MLDFVVGLVVLIGPLLLIYGLGLVVVALFDRLDNSPGDTWLELGYVHAIYFVAGAGGVAVLGMIYVLVFALKALGAWVLR